MNVFTKLLNLSSRVFFPTESAKLQEALRHFHNDYCSDLKARLSPRLLASLVVAEDHRFYSHQGIDVVAILGCPLRLVRSRRVTGASTIEQQLVRTLTGRYERTLARKVREILLASLVGGVIPKSDVPGVYLSVGYFGWQMTGVQRACHRLGWNLREITDAQVALLVARLKYPEPRRTRQEGLARINRRAAYILARMNGSKNIDPAEIGATTSAATAIAPILDL